MKKTFRGLTLAAALLTASGSANADENATVYDGDGPVTPVAFVGDMANHSEDAYFAENAAVAEQAAEAISQTSHVTRAAEELRHHERQLNSTAHQQKPAARQHIAQQMPMMQQPAAQQPQIIGQGVQYEPVSVQQLQPAGYQPAGYQPAGYQPAGYQPVGYQPVGYQPVGYQPVGYQPVGYQQCDTGCASACDAGCTGGCGPTCGLDSGCDSGCDSAYGGSSKSFASMFGLCTTDGWCRHEALLWFVENRESPALVTTAARGDLPIVGFPTTQTVFGDNIEGDMSVGYRLDIGRYVDDNIGIGARFWWLSENKDDYAAGGDGSLISIGRPYYNDDLNLNDAVVVALNGFVEGNVEAESSIDMLAAEAYARLNLSCSKSCQLDLVGGYSYFQVDDTLRITSTSQTSTSARTFSDLFETENRFNGGQVGLETIIKRGRWFARSLTKVHLGDMEQNVRIAGRSVEDFLTPNAPVIVSNSGMLTMGNQGEFERNVFTFVPEINFKLGYRFRDHVEMTVGYSFLYFDRVALAGVNVDPAIDPAFLNTNGPFPQRPAFDFNDTSLWAQGVDLGFAIAY